MTLSEKYREFVKDYEQALDRFCFKNGVEQQEGPAAEAIVNIFKKLASKLYPLTFKEWLDRELKEAIERDDFEYANEVKQEIEKL